MNVLFIEDDVILNDTVTQYLQSKGYYVISLYDGIKSIDTIDKCRFDMFIIDINIPGINGLEIIRHIRKKNSSIPIVVITGSIELEYFKTAYSIGCSDYIKKPFHLEEMDVRINKLFDKPIRLRLSMRIAENIVYDFEHKELIIDGLAKRLRGKERRLLYILLKNANRTLFTQTIEAYVWDNEVRAARITHVFNKSSHRVTHLTESG